MANKSIDHFKRAEAHLAEAERLHARLNGDLGTEYDLSVSLALAQAHIGLAQVQRSGDAAGAVEHMAAHLTKEDNA